jgi:hypothetical protein
MKNVRFVGLDVHAETIARCSHPIHEYQSDQPSHIAAEAAVRLRLTQTDYEKTRSNTA